MFTVDIPGSEFIVFEHGPFNYEQENCNVEEKIENAMTAFDYAETGYCLDTSSGRSLLLPSQRTLHVSHCDYSVNWGKPAVPCENKYGK